VAETDTDPADDVDSDTVAVEAMAPPATVPPDSPGLPITGGGLLALLALGLILVAGGAALALTWSRHHGPGDNPEL
jgi:hypothetical protein